MQHQLSRTSTRYTAHSRNAYCHWAYHLSPNRSSL